MKEEHMMTPMLGNCHDCDARPGMIHSPDCDVERCSYCGGQRLQCECEEHDPEFSRWTGFWPGALEVESMGISLNAVAGHLAMLLYGKPGSRLCDPDVDLINRLLPKLWEVGHDVPHSLINELEAGVPYPEEDEV